MDVHQLDISKILLSSTSNLVSFIFIKPRHFTEAYLVLIKQVTPLATLSSSGFHVPLAERAHLFLRDKTVCGITTTQGDSKETEWETVKKQGDSQESEWKLRIKIRETVRKQNERQ